MSNATTRGPHSGDAVEQPQYKAMLNGVCEAGWEPIPPNGPYGAPGAFEECASAARALKILPVGPWANGSQPSVGGRDEKDLPAGCYYYELPVVGFEVFFGMQGSFSQTDGQRRVICKRRPPLPTEFCCTPNTALTLGHGSMLPFGNDMVLQHGRSAAIFGLAKAGATVVVTYDGKDYTTTANPDPFSPDWNSPLASNSWRVELDPQPPGPAKGNITVSCADCDVNANSAVLERVMFGEVFICSGVCPSKAHCLSQHLTCCFHCHRHRRCHAAGCRSIEYGATIAKYIFVVDRLRGDGHLV